MSRTKKRTNIQNELFELVTVDTARAVKEALERNRLTQKWLIFRLDKDFGIKIQKTALSEVFEGKRSIGKKMQRMLWCAERVIEEYESFYRGRG